MTPHATERATCVEFIMENGKADGACDASSPKIVPAFRASLAAHSALLGEPLDDAALSGSETGWVEPGSSSWRTYNFEVAKHHNYVAQGVRVHNQSILSLLNPDEWSGIQRVEHDENGKPDFVVTRVNRGNIEAETIIKSTEGDTLVGVVETTTSDGLGTVLYERVIRHADGREEVVRELQPLFGQFQGEAVGKALTPFLTRAIIGHDASVFEEIATETFLGTIMENFAGTVGALIDRGIQDYGTFDFGQQFQDISKGVFEDIGQELVINGVNASIGAVNQLIMAEIFGSAAADNVGEAIVQALASATVNSLLTYGAHNLLKSDFFTELFVSVGFDTSQAGQIAGAFGGNANSPTDVINFDPVSLIITTVINQVLPPP